MPIKGLSESRRLPRLGKIHLGIKKKAKSGAMYPSATEYFVVPPEVAEVVGEKPTELPIIFPIEDDEKFASQFYRSYSMTRGLVCRGDGETSRRMVDAHTGEMANQDSSEIAWRDGLPCEGRDCPYYGNKCKEVMNLQFLLPTVEGLGIWQIDTSSINSIRNINSGIELIRGVYGRIAMIPLLLTLEPIEVVNPDDGKKKKVRVLNLRTKGTMIELMERAIKPAREMLLPAPLDTEAPEDMVPPTNGEETDLPAPDEGVPPELIMPQNQEQAKRMTPEEIKKAQAEERMGIVLVCVGGCGKTTEGMTTANRSGEFSEIDESGFPHWTCQECLARDQGKDLNDQAEKEADELFPDDTPPATGDTTPATEAAQTIAVAEPLVPEATIGAAAPTPKLDFEPDELLDSLKKIHWRDSTVKSWLVNHYRVDLAGNITAIVARLNKDQRREFLKEIQDRLEMV